MQPIIKIVGGFKVKIVSLFNSNTPKQTMYGRGKKRSKPKTQKDSEGKKTNSIRNPFLLKKRKKRKRSYRWHNKR